MFPNENPLMQKRSLIAVQHFIVSSIYPFVRRDRTFPKWAIWGRVLKKSIKGDGCQNKGYGIVVKGDGKLLKGKIIKKIIYKKIENILIVSKFLKETTTLN